MSYYIHSLEGKVCQPVQWRKQFSSKVLM